MIPRSEKDGAFSRDVRQVLRASEVGVRWRDNIGPIVEFDYVATKAPVEVPVATTVEPLSLVVLRLTAEGGSMHEAGTVINWSWRSGSLSIELSGLPSSTTKYRVLVGLLMG